MESRPFGVFQLQGQLVDRPGIADLAQALDQRVGADDPKHVETAQGIE